jgi:hypothetical protein
MKGYSDSEDKSPYRAGYLSGFQDIELRALTHKSSSKDTSIRNAAKQIKNPKIMAPTRGLRLLNMLDQIVVAIAPATRAAV